MSTITVVRKNEQIAMAADALTTFNDTRLPPRNDAAPDKIFSVGECHVGIVGYTAHFLVIQDVLTRFPETDLTSRMGIFETFRALHPVLKEEYFLLPDSGQDGDPYESTQVSLLIASPTGIFGVYDMREVHEYTRFWSMGSGASFALGAMHAAYEGDTDAEAIAQLGVETGCEFDRSSAPPVQSFALAVGEATPRRRPKRRVQSGGGPPGRSRGRR